LEQQIAGLSFQTQELTKVIGARKQQLSVMRQEVENNKALAAEGFISRSRVNEIERSRSDLIASLAASMSELGKAQSSLAATRLQLNQATTVYKRDIDAKLADSQKLRNTLRAKVDALRFDSNLTELRAPVNGTVVGMKVHTVGGVIQNGSVLMEIVPAGGELIVEAQVSPELIDKVKAGLEADMRFSAFNHNITPVIPGTVRMVGADRITANMAESSHEYYLAQIATTQEGARLLGKNKVQPGMPVDVVIKTGERTFLGYLFKPLSDRFAKSFKED
jgi:protease secretion system membrane fusion protein